MLNPYSPTVAEGEPAALVWFERSLFNGQHLESVMYGIHLSVFAITACYMLSAPASGRRPWLLITYTFLLFACGTINAAAGIKVAELTWIDDRDVPGGPAAFSVQMYNNNVEIVGNCGYVVANFLADGLLLWRFFMLFGKSTLIALIPGLAFLASTVLGVLVVFQSARPNASMWSHSTVIVAIPYFCLSLALNALLSLLIASRLLWHRRSVLKSLGPGHTEMYTSIAAMFIESAALYAIVGIVYVICFARGSNVQNLLLGILGQVECIAPELILLKVARGQSWNSSTFSKPMSTQLNFRSESSRVSHTSTWLSHSVTAPNESDVDVLGKSTNEGSSSNGAQLVAHFPDESKMTISNPV